MERECKNCKKKYGVLNFLTSGCLMFHYLVLQAKSTSKAKFDDLIQAQISRLRAENVESSMDDVYDRDYRSKLDAERVISNSSKPSGIKDKEYNQILASGLNPAVASLMVQDEDSDSDYSRDVGKKRKRKKDKEKEKKRRKKETKSKKEKKEKKSKKSKKSRKHDYSSDSSSTSSSSSEDEN